ncbi:hypothetical protein OAF73_01005, partial [Planctomycetota bacterium]|nr:hypothetical protein [Planctomycetota bacterium]
MTSLACSNPSCALVGQPVAAAFAQALGGKCPACQGPLEAPGSGLSETADRVIETFPYPIALPLQLLAGKTDVEARAKSLVDVFTNALKFQAMVVQSEYLRSDLVDEDLTTIIRKDLGRPLVSAWIKFVEAAVPRMEAAGIAPFVSELGPAYARAETGRKKDDQIEVPGKGYHDEEGEFIETKAKLGLVRALINYRNKFAHGFNQPEEESRQELDFYLGVLDQLLEELAWMADYTLLKREDGKVWRMMGAEPEVADIEWPQQAVDTGLALLAPDGQRVLPLFPLFIVPRQYVAETKAGEDLLVYDQDTGKRIVYVSPRGHHREIQGTLRPWRKLVAAKDVVLPELDAAALSPEELVRRAAIVTRDTEDQLLASRKLLKGVYVSRPDAEVHLRPFPATSFPLALVTAQAGAGKTTLLHHLAGEWAKGGASVLLARANAIEGADLMAWLRDELRLAASVTPEALA